MSAKEFRDKKERSLRITARGEIQRIVKRDILASQLEMKFSCCDLYC